MASLVPQDSVFSTSLVGANASLSYFHRPWIVLGGGLALSVGTAITPVLLGGEVLEHVLWSFELPLLGKVKTTSALPFDIGVYFVVIGLVLMAYEAFGDDPDDVTERLAAGGAS